VKRDFTFDTYEELLKAGREAGYEHITVREYLGADEAPERFILHRHDVDRKPENALKMARLEAEHGVSSTYYFRTIDKTFRPGILRAIEDLGHEIGYHYEDMDRADGDRERAHELFERELERLREVVQVDTVCMHGNPLTSHDNREMWGEPPGFEEYGLLGEAYLSTDFVDVTYFSDTGRTWEDGALKIKDHPVGECENHHEADTTGELIGLVRAGATDRLCILSHPNRWADGLGEYVIEYSKDAATNIGKIGINIVR